MDFHRVLSDIEARAIYYWPYSVEKERRIVIFGAGSRGPAMARFLEDKGVEVVCLLDNDPAKDGTAVAGRSVYTPTSAPADIFGLPVVVCSAGRDEIYFQCKNLFRHIYLDFNPGIFPSHEDLFEFERKYEAYLDILEDEDSKRCFAGLVAASLTCEDSYRIVSSFRPWTHPVVGLKPGDTMIDIGSFCGAGVISFASSVGDRCRIYALEPHPNFFTCLCENISRAGKEECILPICAGIGTQTGICRFDPMKDTGWARIDEKGALAIYTYDVDTLVERFSIKPNLIASGALGVERFFLDGARKTIRELKPKLMIGTHGGNLKLAFELRELVPEYRFYYGHHNMLMESSLNSRGILYAIADGGRG